MLVNQLPAIYLPEHVVVFVRLLMPRDAIAGCGKVGILGAKIECCVPGCGLRPDAGLYNDDHAASWIGTPALRSWERSPGTW